MDFAFICNSSSHKSYIQWFYFVSNWNFRSWCCCRSCSLRGRRLFTPYPSGLCPVTIMNSPTIKSVLIGMSILYQPRIITTEKTLLEKIDSHTLLLKSCIMSSYFKSIISDCSVASILYTLCWVQKLLHFVKEWNIILQSTDVEHRACGC